MALRKVTIKEKHIVYEPISTMHFMHHSHHAMDKGRLAGAWALQKKQFSWLLLLDQFKIFR